MTGLTRMLVLCKASESLDLGITNSWLQEVRPTGPLKLWTSHFKRRLFSRDSLQNISLNLGIALDEAERMGLFLPATLQAKETIRKRPVSDGFAMMVPKL